MTSQVAQYDHTSTWPERPGIQYLLNSHSRHGVTNDTATLALVDLGLIVSCQLPKRHRVGKRL